MSSQLTALTHGTNGFVLAYATVFVPMFVGLRQGRAPADKLWRSPLLAALLMVAAAIALELASPLLPALGVGRESVLQLIFDVVVSAAIGYAGGRLVAARTRSASGTSYRRGAVVSNSQPLRGRGVARLWSRDARGAPDPNVPITLAGCPVALEDETKHFKFIGTTGTGKSTAIREIVNTALARGDRAIIADPDGGYLGNFYNGDRGDVILNPFEADAAKWNLIGEITTEYDVEQLARSLIPDSGEPERIWSEYARTFFTAVTQQAFAGGINDDGEVYRLLTTASVKELKILLADTPAGPFVEEGNEKMFGSLRSVTSSAVRALKYTTRQQGTSFSVREWVRQGAARHAGGQGGVLFFPYKAGEIAALRSTISAWMRIAIFEAMNRGEGDQRLWFIIDELDALGEIDGLKDALARLRKFGGRCVLGFQSIAQVSGTYGKGTADTIVENCGTTLILRCSASEHGGTSEFASKLIGQREVLHTTQSKTRRSEEWRASTTTSEHVKIEPAVMASEIERLPDLEGFLKFASTPDWRRARLTPVRYPSVVRSNRRSAAASAPAAPAGGPYASAIAVTTQPAPHPAKSTRPVRKRARKPRAKVTQATVAPTTAKSSDDHRDAP
jgi:type IV secretory pathway TraG/TraD family ATPase VirD4